MSKVTTSWGKHRGDNGDCYVGQLDLHARPNEWGDWPYMKRVGDCGGATSTLPAHSSKAGPGELQNELASQEMKHPSQTANSQRRRARQPKLASSRPDRARPVDCTKLPKTPRETQT